MFTKVNVQPKRGTQAVAIALTVLITLVWIAHSRKEAQKALQASAHPFQQRPPTATANLAPNGMEAHQQTSVVCISDTHGIHRWSPAIVYVPPGDVLVFAGDAGLNSLRDAQAFADWLKQQPHTHKVVTWGNMDRYAEKEDMGPLLQGIALIAVDRVVEAGGLRVLGSPFTPKYFGAFQLDDEQAAQQHWSRVLPPDTKVDVLLTHGPPYGVADTSRSSHVGDKALLHAFQALKTPPQLWVVGHIHEAYGVHGVVHESTGKEVVVINSASYYLTRGNADAAPRVVQLPSLHVSQPLGGQTAASGSKGGVWKRPQDPIVL